RLRRRHADVDQRDVGLVHADVAQQIVGRAALGDDLEAGVLEQARYPLTQQDRVVGEDYAHAAEPSARGAERGKPGRQPGRVELEEPLRLVDAGQLVIAEILELVLGV